MLRQPIYQSQTIYHRANGKRLSNGSSSSHSGNFLTPNLTSHSGRRGAAQDAHMHEDVTTTTVGHGGWTLDSINRIFCYLTGNAESDTASQWC